MSDTSVYLMVGAYGIVAIVLIMDELRHRFFQPAWGCSKCGHGPLQANGPAAAFDGRKGFHCPRCGHIMEAYRSKAVLAVILLMSIAVTLGCAAIVVMDMNPDLLGLTHERKPVFWLMYAGLVAGPIGAALSVWLMFRPMPRPHSKGE
jgi:hypothetical protein